jgi:hypothetical protein
MPARRFPSRTAAPRDALNHGLLAELVADGMSVLLFALGVFGGIAGVTSLI